MAVAKLVSAVEAGSELHVELAAALFNSLGGAERIAVMRALSNTSSQHPRAFLSSLQTAAVDPVDIGAILSLLGDPSAENLPAKLRILGERLIAIDRIREPQFTKVRDAAAKVLRDDEKALRAFEDDPSRDCVQRSPDETWPACVFGSRQGCECVSRQVLTDPRAVTSERIARLQTAIEAGGDVQMQLALSLLAGSDLLNGGDLEDTLIALGTFLDREPRKFLMEFARQHLPLGTLERIVIMLPASSVDDWPTQLRMVRARRAALETIRETPLAASRDAAVSALRGSESETREVIVEKLRRCDQLAEAGTDCNVELAVAVWQDLHGADLAHVERALANFPAQHPRPFLTALDAQHLDPASIAKILRTLPPFASDVSTKLRLIRERLAAIEAIKDQELTNVRALAVNVLRAFEKELSGRTADR